MAVCPRDIVCPTWIPASIPGCACPANGACPRGRWCTVCGMSSEASQYACASDDASLMFIGQSQSMSGLKRMKAGNLCFVRRICLQERPVASAVVFVRGRMARKRRLSMQNARRVLLCLVQVSKSGEFSCAFSFVCGRKYNAELCANTFSCFDCHCYLWPGWFCQTAEKIKAGKYGREKSNFREQCQNSRQTLGRAFILRQLHQPGRYESPTQLRREINVWWGGDRVERL